MHAYAHCIVTHLPECLSNADMKMTRDDMYVTVTRRTLNYLKPNIVFHQLYVSCVGVVVTHTYLALTKNRQSDVLFSLSSQELFSLVYEHDTAVTQNSCSHRVTF